MTFPRNQNDNSLDFAAFDKLDKGTRTAILAQLRDENPTEFSEVIKFMQARQEQRKIALQQLEKRDAELTVELNTYTAAYRREIGMTTPARPTVESSKKTIKTCSIS